MPRRIRKCRVELNRIEMNKMTKGMCDILETALPNRKWTLTEVKDYLRDFLLDLGDDENVVFDTEA